MDTRRLIKISAAVAVAVCMTTAVAAQGGPRGERGWGWGMWGNDGPGWGMGMGMMWGRGPWAGRGSDGMLERIEGRLAFLKAELKITETQTTAWNQLADVIRSAAKQRNERMKSVFTGESRTLPERVELQEQFMTVRLEEIKSVKAALKALYAVLSDEQKKEADEMVIPMVGMGGPWT
jgi:hypothetical protein